MILLIRTLLAWVWSLVTNGPDVALENLALRHQLAVLQRTARRPRLTRADRALWIALSRFWTDQWRRVLQIVQPATVIAWHRKGFRAFWTWKSRRSRVGRPALDATTRGLIQTMAQSNVGWGAPRIHGELQKLGIEVSETVVSKYMPRVRKPPSQTWRTFLNNHVGTLVSMDFFTVATVNFRTLYVFVILAHDRRRIVHWNVTECPTAHWASLQLVQAFPENSAPRYLLRDRDGAYGAEFVRRAEVMGIEEVLSAPRSPWQNPYAERLIGSIRREALDHVIVMNERHLRRVLDEYFGYYHRDRTHLSLAKDAPETRPVETQERGNVVALPVLGGLHHRYVRRAA